MSRDSLGFSMTFGGEPLFSDRRKRLSARARVNVHAPLNVPRQAVQIGACASGLRLKTLVCSLPPSSPAHAPSRDLTVDSGAFLANLSCPNAEVVTSEYE